jgi:hypothetical protein
MICSMTLCIQIVSNDDWTKTWTERNCGQTQSIGGCYGEDYEIA